MTTPPVTHIGNEPITIRPRWNTLEVLKAGRIAVCVLVALLLVAVIAGTTVHRNAMKTVGKDAAPSIIAAQQIKSALADMDADAANELLEPAGAEDAIAQAYEARRIEAAKALISAAENITFGDSERAPIQTLQVGMGTYERLIQKARDLHDVGNPGALAAYRNAAQLMDQTLLPAADALDHANNDVLERSYESQSSKSFAARAAVIVAGLVALFGLVLLQGFLSYKTHRTFNPMLLFATLLMAALTLYGLTAMETEQRELKLAKEDAFTSIRALLRARAVAYQANGEESRYLLDPIHSAEYQRTFAAESTALANLPSSVTLDQIVLTETNGHAVENFTGYLADELNNITFPGERQAAVATLVDFERYESIDVEIRRLEQSGQRKQALELCVGTAQGQSNWAFDQFDKALGSTLEINQNAFSASVDKGLSAVASLEIKAALVSVMIAVLVFLGMVARIREYE